MGQTGECQFGGLGPLLKTSWRPLVPVGKNKFFLKTEPNDAGTKEAMGQRRLRM